MLGSIVIANYSTVTTDMLLVMLSQEVHNKMPKLPSEETLLIPARIL